MVLSGNDGSMPMVGMLLVRRKPKNQIFYVAESFVAVSLSWVLLSVMGAAQFVLSGYIPNPIDALFETVSGFTTTGSKYSEQCGAAAELLYYSGGVLRTGLAVWAFCIPSECPADGGRFPYEFDEGGEPRTDREPSRSEGPDDGEAVIPDLPGK